MDSTIRRMFILMLCLVCLLPWLCSIPAGASEHAEEADSRDAENISGQDILTDYDGLNAFTLFDGQTIWGGCTWGDAYFTLAHEKGIGSLYIIFQYEYDSYELVNNDTGETVTVAPKYLHDYVDVQAMFGTCPSSVTVRFTSGRAYFNEVYAFTAGKVPDFVQQWDAPMDGRTDLILFSTHADDEHLFFAGLLPYYGQELGYQVQVVYLTNHRSYTPERAHELLNGLWAVGIRSYPVMGTFNDFNVGGLWATYQQYAALGYSREKLQSFVVEQLRRFKPKVVVTHDFNGEYGHGMHMVMADLVASGLEISADPEQYTQSAQQYGTWDVPKAYFHLYNENPIVMDWDQPLDSFGGMTAFQVSTQIGFQQHRSQIRDYAWYYAGYPSAASIPRYNPCQFGLYRSLVGEDVEKNDFFENVLTYDQERQAEEARLAEEEARRRAEEEARKQAEEEAQRKAEEEARRKALEVARKKAEEEQAQQEQLQQIQRQHQIRMLICIIGVCFLLIFTVLSLLFRPKKFP